MLVLVTSISVAVQGNLNLTFLVIVLWHFSVHFRFHLYAWPNVDTKLDLRTINVVLPMQYKVA
jgi:glucose-6-phosphate-specific signal transduction histidine kinase